MNKITRMGVRPRLPGHRHVATVLAVALSTGGLGLGLALSGAAVPSMAQAALPSGCSQAAIGAAVVCSFGYTGAEQTFTVPAGVTEVTLTATGASGGTAVYGTAGLGGVATDTAAVTPNQTLYVEVGGAGGSNTTFGQAGAAGGFNGGGAGGAGSPAEGSTKAGDGGGGGGGASDVRTLPASDGLSPTDSRLVVGGGGGGGCDFSAGGSAGSPGGASYNGTNGGGAGTLTGGGAGGNGEGVGSGADGTLGGGGAGGTPATPFDGYGGGCGGGGGYYGGGGGSVQASGGGGSSYAPGGTTSIAASTGNGSVTIAFAPPAGAAALQLSPASATVGLGGSQSYQAVTVDAIGATLADVTPATTFTMSPSGSCAAAVCTPVAAGGFEVTGTDGSLTGAAQLTVSQATPQVTLSASPMTGDATAATPVTLTATVLGLAGVDSPTGSVTFGGAAASCGTVGLVAGTASCALGDLPTGTYSFSAAYSGDSNYVTGTPASLTGYPVSLQTQSVSFTSNPPSPADYGGSYAPAASATSGLPVSFSIDSTSTPGACALDASTGVVSFTGTGTCVIDADQAGNSGYAPAQAQQSFAIVSATTTTTVAVSATALTATVTAVPPGGGTPSGTVTFAVQGNTVGTAPLSAQGTATLAYASSGAETVSAAYAGDADYLPSSASTATRNPVITAKVTSKYPKSKYGWYRSPVTVSFTCTAGSAPLTAPCPGSLTLSRNAADQVVSRTIHGADGGIATASVTVSIDQGKPAVSVTGIKNHATYEAPGPAKIGCKASEHLSGLAAPCKLTVHRTEAAITWTATATSRAGVTTTIRGRAGLTDFYVAGATLRHGRYLVTVKHTYTVVAYLLGAKKAPRYVYAAPAGVRPHPVGPKMNKIGPSLWAIRATITTKMRRKYENWTLGVLAGRTLYLIQITLRR
jgi:Bacterial Ig-like domain (group 3)/Glycine rich protein